MHTKLLAATALAGSLLLMPMMQGSARSATLPSLPFIQAVEEAALVVPAKLTLWVEMGPTPWAEMSLML